MHDFCNALLGTIGIWEVLVWDSRLTEKFTATIALMVVPFQEMTFWYAWVSTGIIAFCLS